MANIEKSVMFQGYPYMVVDVEVDGNQYVAENLGAGVYNVMGECLDENGQVHILLLYCNRCSEGRSENCDVDLRGGHDVCLKLDNNGALQADDD